MLYLAIALAIGSLGSGCWNNPGDEYYRVFSERIEEVQKREMAQDTPIHGRMKLVIEDVQQLPSSFGIEKGDPESGKIYVEFSIFSRRDAFTLDFSDSITASGLSGESYSVTVSDGDLVIDTTSNGSIELPAGVLYIEDYENVFAENLGYIWGVYCVFVHLFPLTEGWIDVNMFVSFVDYADKVVMEGRSDGEVQVEALMWPALEWSWITDISYSRPVLTHKREVAHEIVSYEYAFTEYSVWDEGDLLLPRKVAGDRLGGKYRSELLTVSSSPLPE